MNTTNQQKELSLLEEAICDIGLLSWWDAGLPDVFQLEFDRVQLLTLGQEKEKAPSRAIALAFRNPYRVAFSETGDEKWYEKLKNEEIKQLQLSPESLKFNEEPSFIASLPPSKYFFHSDKEKPENTISVSVTVGEYIVFVEAEKMEIKDKNGIIEYEDIQSRSEAWWDYWQKYWDKKDTPEAYPYDAACEITIPMAG